MKHPVAAGSGGAAAALPGERLAVSRWTQLLENQRALAVALLAPGVAILTIFIAYPFVMAIWFSLTDIRRAAALELSGGERRRVEIARALASGPSFILLDEPLAGIDPINVSEIRELVAHLKDRGLGVLITDHNVRDMLDIIDRAYILHEGRVLTEGVPGEIIAHEGVRRVYLGDRFTL